MKSLNQLSKDSRVTEELAVNGGPGVRRKEFPSWPIRDKKEKDEIFKAFDQVYESGIEGLGGINPGSMVSEFQKLFAHYCGVEHAIMTPHGTDAIRLSILALTNVYEKRRNPGIKVNRIKITPKDAVIIPNYTFLATAGAVLEAGGSVIFVDIDPETYTLSPDAMEKAIIKYKDKYNIIGAIPVHLCGFPANMKAIMAIAEKHGLWVVEDAAQAHGAEIDGVKVGALGNAGAFSFQSSKNLCSGEGGCLTTTHKEVAEEAYALTNAGRSRGGKRWEYPHMGGNLRASEYIAALLISRLSRLEEQTKLRNENAENFMRLLSEIDGLIPAQTKTEYKFRHAYHLFMALYSEADFAGQPIDNFIRMLSKEGIPCTRSYTRPLSHTESFANYGVRFPSEIINDSSFPNALTASHRGIWWFQNQFLGTSDDIEDMVVAILKIRNHL